MVFTNVFNPGMPVFIDSRLGIRITWLYQDMDDCWDREAKALKASGNHPVRFKHLYALEKFQDHRRLLHLKDPAVIIAEKIGFKNLVIIISSYR
jgi:metallo-beta-lactamase family protein